MKHSCVCECRTLGIIERPLWTPLPAASSSDHIRHCIVDAVEEGDEQAITDLCAAIDKFFK